MNDKIGAILGLAMRGRKLILGIDNIEAYKGKIYGVYFDGGLSERSQRNIAFIAAKRGAVLIKSEMAIESVTGKTKCMAAALTDKNMHDGIVKALTDETAANGKWQIVNGK